MLTEDQILAIAQEVGKNPTQQGVAAKAIRETLVQVADLTMSGDVPDHTTPLASPTAETVLCICSANTLTSAETRTMIPALEKALAKFGTLEIVTFGNRGGEAMARRWASQNGVANREFEPAWAVPNGDGTTTHDGRAFQTRDNIVKAYVAQAKTLLAILVGARNDTRYASAQRMFTTLVAAGANEQARKAAAQAELEAKAAMVAARQTPPVAVEEGEPVTLDLDPTESGDENDRAAADLAEQAAIADAQGS